MPFPKLEAFRSYFARAEHEPGGKSRSSEGLPPCTPESVKKLWRSHQKAAVALLPEIDRAIAVDVKKRQGKGIEGRDPSRTPLFPLEKRFQVELENPMFTGLLKTLDASDIGSHAIILSHTDFQDAIAVAALALERQIRLWVDTRTARERGDCPHCVDDSKELITGGDCAIFQRGRRKPLPLDSTDAEAHALGVSVQLHLAEKPVQRSDLGWPLPRGKDAEAKVLIRKLNIPLEAHHAVRPDLLFDLMPHIGALTDQVRSTIVFQCVDGGRRSAVLAAAYQLYQEASRGRLFIETLEDAVLKACVMVRTHRSCSLIDDEDLTTLLSFGEMLVLRAASRPVMEMWANKERRVTFSTEEALVHQYEPVLYEPDPEPASHKTEEGAIDDSKTSAPR